MNGRSLNFVGTMKHRNSAREELLTEPKLLSDWAVQGGLVDAAIDVTDDDLSPRSSCGKPYIGRLPLDSTAAGSSPPTSTCSTSALPARSSRHDYCAPAPPAVTAPHRNCWRPWPRICSTCWPALMWDGHLRQ
jgi:hypothetical protein